MSHDAFPSKEPINLMRGWPNSALLPISLIKEAAHAVLSDHDLASTALAYGPDPGDESAREAIAALLTRFYQPQLPVEPNRICVTGGASQSLGGILSTFTDPEYTRNIWIVSPAYMLVFRVFADEGFGSKMRAVPEDEHGVDIDFLRSSIRRSEEDAVRAGNVRPRYKSDIRRGAKVYKHIIYCVPTFSNPSGRSMDRQRRTDLVRLAREYDALIVPDDVYDFLHWSRDGSLNNSPNKAHLPRLVDIDRQLDGGPERSLADGFGNACSNGSFSKIAGPGIRVGWLEGSTKFTYGISQWGAQASGGAPSQLTSSYITQLLSSGQLEHHIHHVLRPAYAARYTLLMQAVSTHLLPLGFHIPPSSECEIAGGYFIWLELPASLDAGDLAARCRAEESLIVAPGGVFNVPSESGGSSSADHLRLCFAWEDEWKLEEGIRRLGVVSKRMAEEVAA